MNNTIIIAQRAYDCTSVSVNNISKACKEIQELSLHCNNITELCNSMDTPTICNALSLLFAGNLSLAKDFSLGQRTELGRCLSNLIFRHLAQCPKIRNYGTEDM